MMRGLLAVGVLTALTLAWSDTRAEPLDAATCGLLKGELSQLEEAGVRDSMAKGPQWAKSNLTADGLQRIRRLMELDEQLLFRCSAKTLVDLPSEDDAAENQPGAKDNGKDKGPSKAGEQSAKQDKKSPAAKAAPAAAAAKDKSPAKAPQKKADPSKKEAAKTPAVKPKPKVDDAYRPPPPNPNVDPFANRPARQ